MTLTNIIWAQNKTIWQSQVRKLSYLVNSSFALFSLSNLFFSSILCCRSVAAIFSLSTSAIFCFFIFSSIASSFLCCSREDTSRFHWIVLMILVSFPIQVVTLARWHLARYIIAIVWQVAQQNTIIKWTNSKHLLELLFVLDFYKYFRIVLFCFLTCSRYSALSANLYRYMARCSMGSGGW